MRGQLARSVSLLAHLAHWARASRLARSEQLAWFFFLAPIATREQLAGNFSARRWAMADQLACTSSVWRRLQCANSWHAAPRNLSHWAWALASGAPRTAVAKFGMPAPTTARETRVGNF